MIEPDSKETARLQRINKNKLDSFPILSDLSQIGINVEWISDLFYRNKKYRSAIPVLLKWLPLVDNPDVKESIVRALSVPWARNTTAPSLLIREFKNAHLDSGLQWAIGNALSVVASDDETNEIISLIRDKTYGKSREMLVIALGNMKHSDVEDFLIDILEDEDLIGYAIMALGKKKSIKARLHIERYKSHPKSWVRREARKAIQRIDKQYS